MELLLEFDGLTLPARADGAERADDGYVLTGARVAALHPFGATRFYRHGWQSWSRTDWLDLGAPPELIEPPERRAQGEDPAYASTLAHIGSGVGALEGPDGRVLLLGALDLDARVEAGVDTLCGACGAGGAWFMTFADETTAFARYAARLAARLGRRGEQPAPRVWCSWYGLYLNIAEPLLAAILPGLQDLAFDVFQIDDGWEQGIGAWTANEKFPSGMAALAARARDAGFRPGLWIAPFIVRSDTPLAREHPDWLLHDEGGGLVNAGENWGGPCYALDTTHPEAQAWVDALVRGAVDWGYTYLKLDFLYAGALPGARHESLPREQAYRLALQRIRAAVGDDTYLLACGAPVLPSLGIADAIRVGPDVAPYWDNEDRRRYLHDWTGPGSVNALSTSLQRLWLRPLIHTDPDVVYFRTRYNLLMPEEQACLRRLAFAAGFKATSDLPFWLDPPEREALQAFLLADPEVRRLGRYSFRIGEETVDFAPVLGANVSIGGIWQSSAG